MKATELRIGNLTQDSKGNLLKVIGLTDDNISYYVVDRSKFPLEVGWQAKPIPLTEEWLVKFGFEYYKPLNHFRIVIDDIWYSIQSNYKKLDGFWFTYVNLNVCEVNHMPFKEIKHIHQLQNLYFALTGEELTIK
jgi:hypothetical protein